MEIDLVKLKKIIDENNTKDSKFRKRLEKLTIETIIQKSKNKDYMRDKYGCKFCAFYHQIDLNNEQLETLIYKNLIKKFFRLTNIDISKYDFTGKKLGKTETSLLNHKDELLKSILVKSVEKIKHELPSLCIYKNEINTKPCYHYTLKVLDVDIRDRLEYHNYKINRRNNSLSMLLSTLLSLIAIFISILSLFYNVPLFNQFSAHEALALTAGLVTIELNKSVFSLLSLI